MIRRGLPSRVGGHGILAVLVATVLLPFYLVVVNSLKLQSDIVRNPLTPPSSPEWGNFVEAWTFANLGRGYINSIILTGTTVLVVLVCASLAGYVLAGKKIRVWPFVMIYFMLAMTVPIQLFLFPLYFIFARLSLLGNLVAVGVVLAALFMPFAVLLMRAFFLRVPKDLEDAARVDGATTYQLFRYVLLPAVSPGLITVGVVVGLMAWNEYLITRTFIIGERNFTAPLGYLSMHGTFTVNQGAMMAGALLLIVPIVVLFLFVQRYFVEAFVSGSVKG